MPRAGLKSAHGLRPATATLRKIDDEWAPTSGAVVACRGNVCGAGGRGAGRAHAPPGNDMRYLPSRGGAIAAEDRHGDWHGTAPGPGTAARAPQTDDGTVWIGTSGGLS